MDEYKSKTLTLASSFDQIKRIETFVDELKKWGKTDEEQLNNIQLAVNEAVTNAIVHGNKKDASKKVRISAQIDENEIEITVKDEGSGFDPSSLPDPREHNQLFKQGGRGVFLIKQYTDEVFFEEKGTLVRMKFFTA